MNTVIKSISKQIEIHKIYCWTDSQISLWWIRQQTKTWKVWIQNRVNRIRTFLSLNSWKYIRTNENPADIGTRRTKPDALLSKTLWWKGPSLLNSLQYSFDSYCVCCEGRDTCSFVDCEISGWEPGDEIDVEEKRVIVAMKGTIEVASGIGAIINVKRFSCLERMLRVTAYVLRFCTKLFEKLKKKVDKLRGVGNVMKETCLTVDELLDADRCWVRYEQTLMSRESEKFEKLKGPLNLFYDKSGLFRSQTRIDRCSKLNYNTVNLILLRKEYHFTKLIVLRAHENVFHSGLESTLTNVRSNYWIIKGRQFVKKVLKHCYVCKLI